MDQSLLCLLALEAELISQPETLTAEVWFKQSNFMVTFAVEQLYIVDEV